MSMNFFSPSNAPNGPSSPLTSSVLAATKKASPTPTKPPSKKPPTPVSNPTNLCAGCFRRGRLSHEGRAPQGSPLSVGAQYLRRPMYAQWLRLEGVLAFCAVCRGILFLFFQFLFSASFTAHSEPARSRETRSAEPSLQFPSPYCPPAPHPSPAPTAKPFARGRACLSRALPAKLPTATCFRLFPGALSTGVAHELLAQHPGKSSTPHWEKPRSRCRVLPSPLRHPAPRAVVRQPALRALPQSSPTVTLPAPLLRCESLPSLPAHLEKRGFSIPPLLALPTAPSTRCAFRALALPIANHPPLECRAPKPSAPPHDTSPRCRDTNIPASLPHAAQRCSSPIPQAHQSQSSILPSFSHH